MPENEVSPQPISPEVEKQSEKTIINLEKKPKEIKISRTKFFIILVLALTLIILEIPSFYYLGVQNEKNKNNQAQLEKKEVKKTESREPDVKTVDLGEEVTVKSGITLTLEEAKYDQGYEKQKNESKSYYEKNASQSAYLDSDYFKNSQLNLKVSLNNETTKAVSYSPSSFRLKDSDDVQYVANYEGDKQVYGLNPEEKTRINLNYIVPTSEKKFRLIYENAVFEFAVK